MSTPTRLYETPIGHVEISELFDVARTTPHLWQQRNLLPPPKWRASNTPLWRALTIIVWGIRTGRLNQFTISWADHYMQRHADTFPGDVLAAIDLSCERCVTGNGKHSATCHTPEETLLIMKELEA